MNKWAIIGGVVLIAGIGFAFKYVHDDGIEIGAQRERERQVAKRDTVTNTVHDTLNSVTLRKVYVPQRDTIIERVPSILRAESVTLGTQELGVTFDFIDNENEYQFLHPSFTYPSRTVTETKYLERPVPFFDGIEFGMMLSSSFKHFSVEGTPYVSLPLNFGGTKISSWIGYRISEQEPQARYGVQIGW